MINPNNITNMNRTKDELEEFLLFSILVAGKKASTTAKKLDLFLNKRKSHGKEDHSPLEFVEYLVQSCGLMHVLNYCKLGQYNRIHKAFKGVLKFKNRLENVTPEELVSVDGIGPKTARFFVLHSRPEQSYAVLDTHILKWLRAHGVKAPRSTPTRKKYMELEKKFLTYASQYGIDPASLDLQIWKSYSKA